VFLIGLLLNVGRRPVFAPRTQTAAAPAAKRRRQRVRVVTA
jgi:hypothetical protein